MKLSSLYLPLVAALLLANAAQAQERAQEIVIPSDTAGVDLAAIAKRICPDANAATVEKVCAVVSWTNRNFQWTHTDYQRRTVKEIICRKGGNCNEQALVARALMKEIGVKTRKTAEINIQPESERRQKNAEEKVAQNGKRMSVFGLRHNDHVWTEFFDEQTLSWQPADPTLNLFGLEAWTRARVGFSERAAHNVIPSRDMLVPIAIFALNPDGSIAENRSEHYLTRSFDAVYGGKLSAAPQWKLWQEAIGFIAPKCQSAFEGKESLHAYADNINEIKTMYGNLKAWYERENK